MNTRTVITPNGIRIEGVPETVTDQQAISWASQTNPTGPISQKLGADAYAGQDVSQMSTLGKVGGGAKAGWDLVAGGTQDAVAAAYGPQGAPRRSIIKSLGVGPALLETVANPTTMEQKQNIQQGRQFVREAGFPAAVGNFGVDALTFAGAPGATIPGRMASQGVMAATVSPENRGSNAISAVAAEGAGGMLGKLAGRLFGGPLREIGENAEDYAEVTGRGINVPPWKALDPRASGARSITERAKVLPHVGAAMTDAEKKAFEDVNRQYMRRATPPKPVVGRSGETEWVDAPVETIGPKGIEELHRRYDDFFREAYKDFALPRADVVRLNVSLDDVVKETKEFLPGSASDVLGTVNRIKQSLPMKGKEFHSNDAFQEALDVVEAARQEAWNNGQARLAQTYGDMYDLMDNVRLENLPASVREQVSGIGDSYGVFKIISRAMNNKAAQKEGMFTPDQLLAAIKSNDSSAGKLRFSKGAAGPRDMQRAASQEARLLGSQLPAVGPGTAEKTLLTSAASLPLYIVDRATGALIRNPAFKDATLGNLPGQGAVRATEKWIPPVMGTLGVAASQERDIYGRPNLFVDVPPIAYGGPK